MECDDASRQVWAGFADTRKILRNCAFRKRDCKVKYGMFGIKV